MTTEHRYFEIITDALGGHITLRLDPTWEWPQPSIRLGYGTRRSEDAELVWLDTVEAAELRDALTALLGADDLGDGEDVGT